MHSLSKNILALAPLMLRALPSVIADDGSSSDNDIPYTACPLIGTYYPPPTINKSSDTFVSLTEDFTSVFDKLIQDGGSDKYGEISPNTTSFSVVLFSGAESAKDDPAFFEYHYTAPESGSKGGNLTADTKFPVGDLTMVTTVYAWLVKMGETWDAPITKFLPELKQKDDESESYVSWEDITIGALAGQLSGLPRESHLCVVGEPCNLQDFVQDFKDEYPIFLPDTTPMVSYAAFQLLAAAMQRDSNNATDFSDILQQVVFGPLNMTNSGLLNKDSDIFAADGVNLTQPGEPAALSLTTSINDLARLGHAILSSQLVSSPAVTRRWLRHQVDTSNLRNGVGRPWEVYRAGSSAISPVMDVLTKSGTIGQYASYFGLTHDFNAGFAIVAHDPTVADRKLDLNVYADVVSEALVLLQQLAAKELAARFAGTYGHRHDNRSVAVLNITENGPGLQVQKLVVEGVDIRSKIAAELGMKSEKDLDFRLYPTNLQDKQGQHFVAVFQDESAPIDMGTPTCITWQEVGATAAYEFWFVLDKKTGLARAFGFRGAGDILYRS